jgi:hypothetical protein
MICPNCKTENQSIAKYCRSCGKELIPAFPEFIEHKANFNTGIISIGGKIIITPTQLIFHAHSFNVGNLEDRIFEIKDIIGYKKGLLTLLTICFSDGKNIRLTVWGKDEIINQLEKRRNALQR